MTGQNDRNRFHFRRAIFGISFQMWGNLTIENPSSHISNGNVPAPSQADRSDSVKGVNQLPLKSVPGLSMMDNAGVGTQNRIDGQMAGSMYTRMRKPY